jgi:hypothetical protein
MRAPAPTFRNAIAAYRKAIISDPRRGPGFGIVVGILDRLNDQTDIEDIWNKMKPRLPNVPAAAGLFITGIIKARLHAEAVDQLVEELPVVERKSVSRTKGFLAKKQFEAAAIEMSMIGTVSEGRKRLFSRKSESAAQVNFMVALRSYFADECGQPFDDVVATLTNIAFNINWVTADHVRDAGRATGRRRDIRPQK